MTTHRPASRRKRPLPLPLFERRVEPLLPLHVFWKRLLRSVLWACLVLAVSLGIGVIGYHAYAGLGWIDAILNASMILAGMGPVDTLHTASSKLFASAYAIFSGVAFLTSVGVIVTPLFHRFLHHFHLELDDDEPEPPTAKR